MTILTSLLAALAKDRPVILSLHFSEERRPSLLSISSIIYDIGLVHDFAALVTSEKYSNFKFTRYFWYRGGRKLRPEHAAKAIRIEKHSPLLVEIGTTVAIVWGVIQILDKVESWPRARRKAMLELEKLQNEVGTLREKQLQEEIARRGAEEIEVRLVRRLDRSEIKLIDLEVRADNPDAGESQTEPRDQ